MLHKIILSTVGLFLLGNCKNQQASANSQSEVTTKTATTSTPVKENNSGIIYLKEAQSLYLKENKMKVTFKNMTEDSRCPEGVNCIWEGVATAEIELLGESKRPLTILLSTMDNPQKGHQKVANFQEYNYSLVEVSPQTTSDKGFKALKGQYKIGLKIEKGSSENPILQRN